MSLVTAEEVRTAGMFPSGSAATLDSPLTNVYIPEASSRLKKWVGAVAYADAESDTPEDEDRAAVLKRSELFLALEGIYRGAINTHFDQGGLVGSIGGPDGGSTAFIKPEEANKMADRYLAMAEQAAEPYSILDTDLSPIKSSAYYDDGEEME